jgi:hypothetical protein
VRGIPRGMDVALNVNKSLGPNPDPPQGDELNPNLLLLRQFFLKDKLATEYSLFLQRIIHNNAKLSTRRKKKS